jgi:hypothetical protein
MKLNKLIRIGDALEVVADQTNTHAKELVDALIGVAFCEEDAADLKNYLKEDGID